MANRRPDPSPFGSREKSQGPDVPRWVTTEIMGAPYRLDDATSARRLSAEFFQMLRAFRFTKTRLIIEAAVAVAGVVLVVWVPVLGVAFGSIAVVAGIADLVLYSRLRTRVKQAWEDLSRDPS